MRVSCLKLTAKFWAMPFRLKLRRDRIVWGVQGWLYWRRAMAGLTVRDLQNAAATTNPAWRQIYLRGADRAARAFFRGRWAREDEP